MKLRQSLCIAFLAISLSSSAQVYQQAGGIRIGPSTPAIKAGLSYKYFLSETSAVEGILSLKDGIGFCGLFEIHHPLTLPNLQWLYGLGAYVSGARGKTLVGLAGIIGLDYKFESLPINLTLDYKPELNLSEKLYLEGSTVGFSVRYVF